jgi:hypothetical protein
MAFRTPGLNEKPKVRRKKFNYVGAPKIFALELACSHLWRGFATPAKYGGCYIVGSALQRADWRDVDVVCILDDASFATLFPDAGDAKDGCARFEHDQRWLVMTVALSDWLSKQSGLPIDFKFQPMTMANLMHDGPRNPVGLSDLRYAKA